MVHLLVLLFGVVEVVIGLIILGHAIIELPERQGGVLVVVGIGVVLYVLPDLSSDVRDDRLTLLTRTAELLKALLPVFVSIVERCLRTIDLLLLHPLILLPPGSMCRADSSDVCH